MWYRRYGCPNMLGYSKFLVVLAGAFRVSRFVWWAHQDSNLGPSDYESDALTN
jgi:hypothetical protein